MTILKNTTQLTAKAKLNLVESCLRELRNPTSIAPPLPEHLLASLANLEREMRDSRNQLIDKTEAATRLNQAYRDALDLLRVRIRHAFQLVKRKTKLPNFPASIVASFGLKTDGTYSQALAKLPQPIQTARDIIQAEVSAAELGYSVLSDPSPTELAELVAQAEHLEALRSVAVSEEVICRQRAQTATLACDQTMRQIQNYLRFALTGMNKDKFRQVMKALGFTYVNTKAKIDDSNDDTAQQTTETNAASAAPDAASSADESSVEAVSGAPIQTEDSFSESDLTPAEATFFADVFAAQDEAIQSSEDEEQIAA